jgi:hypothetical protein
VTRKTRYADYELHLPYFKQGADLAVCIEDTKSIPEAMVAHAKMLEASAKILREVASRLIGNEVDVHADCHYIGISGRRSDLKNIKDLEEVKNDEE